MTCPGPGCVPISQKAEGHQALQHNREIREHQNTRDEDFQFRLPHVKSMEVITPFLITRKKLNKLKIHNFL